MIEALPHFSARRRGAVKAGNRCGYFTPEQYQKILQAIPFYRPRAGKMPENFAARMLAYVELGRWSGMSGADIVRFSPRENLVGDVITYRRTKCSSQIAGPIVLPAAVAERLRHIPLEPGASPEAPFYMAEWATKSAHGGRGERRVRGMWRDRFQDLCRFAGIGEIKTEIGTVRRPHPHMLRDTFAIDAILRGVRLDNVAKMLGHATTEMTQKAYLFWVKQREIYCEQEQRTALASLDLANVPAAAAASSGTQAASMEGLRNRSPLVQ
jgi:integrase